MKSVVYRGNVFAYFPILILMGIVLSVLISCGSDSPTDSNDQDPPVDTTWSPTSTISGYTWSNQYNTSVELLYYANPYLYAVGRGGFLGVLNVSSADTMVIVGQRASNGNINTQMPNYTSSTGVAKHGNYLYSLMYTSYDEPDSIAVFDVSSPSSPSQVNALNSFSYGGSQFGTWSGVTLVGDSVLAVERQLHVYRFVSPANINHLVQINIDDLMGMATGGTLSGIVQVADYLYITGTHVTTEQIPKLFVVERGSLSTVSEIDLPSECVFATPWPVEGAVYLCNYDGVVVRADISNPANPLVGAPISIWDSVGVASGGRTCITQADTMLVVWHSGGGGAILCDSELRLVRTFPLGLGGIYDCVEAYGRIYMATSTGLHSFELP